MRFIAITAVAATVSACSTFDPATRSAPIDVPGLQAVAPSFDVTELRVTVPRDLRVSEANVYYPIADIVWRGDPIGDRYMQVRDLVGQSMQRGTDQLQGVQRVAVDVDVTRFHSLTEKARYTVGGVHSIKFNLTVRDAATGAIIVPTRAVNGDLSALGGRAAIEAERKGITQKSRISNHLTLLIQQELSRPLVSNGNAI
ncbi:MAG: DUF6778 family protein [Pseudomonadota bacterium]